MRTYNISSITARKIVAVFTLAAFLLVWCAPSALAFTRLQAIDLQRRLAQLEQLDNPEGENLFSVAREMNRVTGSSFGPSPLNFSDTVMLRLKGSFGEGRDSASLDVLSVKDIGYGEMLEGGLPVITFQKDSNPGIVANLGHDPGEGLQLADTQFAQVVGGAPAIATSYIVGGILLATVGVAIVGASSGGGSDSGQGQTQASSSSQPQTTGQPQGAAQTPGEPGQPQGAAQQPDDPVQPQGNPDDNTNDNNRDGEKNQPSGKGVGFDDAHDKKDKDDDDDDD